MPRTEAKWKVTWGRLCWLIDFHKKPFWIFATEDDYVVSAIEPDRTDLPEGATAAMWGPSEDGYEVVRKKHFTQEYSIDASDHGRE